MPIGEQSPIASHTGNGVATVFAYSFGVLAADDIKVLVDGVQVTTGFTVTGIGSRTGGPVVFSVGRATGPDVPIVREVVRARSTDYQANGDLREEVLDDDFDRTWMALQEDGELVQRGVRAPVGETLSELPVAASRVDKVLTFGAGGAIALVDIAAFSGGGVVELVPADGSIALVKLTPALQALINGALQRSGGTMAGKIVLDGDATLALHPTTKQQVDAAVAPLMRREFYASVATTSGTSKDLPVPSWAKRLTVMMAGVSGSAPGAIKLRAIVGGLEVSSGYTGTYVFNGASAAVNTVTDAFCQYDLTNGSTNLHGDTVLTLAEANTWVCRGAVARHGGSAEFQQHAGSTPLSGVMTDVRVISTGGAFDNGIVVLLAEG